MSPKTATVISLTGSQQGLIKPLLERNIRLGKGNMEQVPNPTHVASDCPRVRGMFSLLLVQTSVRYRTHLYKHRT